MSVSPFADMNELRSAFAGRGVQQLLFKQLAENDNSKQQIYLGPNFDVLKLLPFREVVAHPGGKRPNFKAGIQLAWIDSHQTPEVAKGAQLILYPDYPEVRLSGFLFGCRGAPNTLLRHIPKALRRYHGKPDGRVLVLGVAEDGQTLAYVAEAGSTVATAAMEEIGTGQLRQEGVLHVADLVSSGGSRERLLSALVGICDGTWHASQRLGKDGASMSYIARNAGGYTLEALLGIKPNGNSEPDYLGWEIKGFGGDRITLMTPEPDAGFYGDFGTRQFVEKYGRQTHADRFDFTGTHRVGVRCKTTGLTLLLNGFDPKKGKVIDVNGGIELVDDSGNIAARWSFASLLNHWGRKHAFAAYVPYRSRTEPSADYQFESVVQLGEGTEFLLLLEALASGVVYYDPASKVEIGSSGKSRVKARSQFRIRERDLKSLYTRFEPVSVR